MNWDVTCCRYLSEVTVVLLDNELSLDKKENVVTNPRSVKGSEKPPTRVCVKEVVASFVMKKRRNSCMALLEIDRVP